jgi:outer membrane protein
MKLRLNIQQTMALLVFGFTTTSILAVTGQVQAKPGSKYGVVDMQTVILNVTEGKTARADLEKEIKGKQKEFQDKKKELDKLNEDWKTQAALLSEAARMKKQQEFQENFMGLRNAEMTFESEIKRKEQKATQQIAMKVAKLVDEMSTKLGLEAVYETNTAGLLYLKDPVDMTKDVIDAYEKGAKSAPIAKKEETKKEEKK